MTRDRDPTGRPRNSRPRDALGRPQPRTADDVADLDPPTLPAEDALEEAQRLLDDGFAFRAHEVLEAVWKATTGSERDLWRGLAQLAVGLTHRARGNELGARALLQRAAETLAPFDDDPPHGVAVRELRRWAIATAVDSDAVAAMPRLRSQAADDLA